mgnify:FL=1|tara:strand:- start:643 stop:921 length:279 start_codon:yes stop_codon:yes gene_type:complete
MGLLSKDEIREKISSLKDWKYSNNTITKKFSFKSYLSGIEFVNKLAKLAEEKNHHPDLYIGWCNVQVSYTSHDQGGVTDECVNMAELTDSEQ